jgi:aspartate/methionine/tyrosine aminotransferase
MSFYLKKDIRLSIGEQMSKERLDMQYGNPYFMQDLYTLGTAINASTQNSVLSLSESMAYEYSKGPHILLEDEIRALHSRHNNVDTRGAEIIVTPGAVFALSACIYAIQKLYYNSEATRLYSRAPYWGRFEAVAKQQGLTLTSDEYAKYHDNTITLLTAPNNPDGLLPKDPDSRIDDIVDACYNWPHYTEVVRPYQGLCTVFSLSKYSGHSSTRIGWVVTKDKDLANLIHEYLELFASGVSIDAQMRAHRVIRMMNLNPDIEVQAKNTLKRRHERIAHIVGKNYKDVKIISKRGMFLYLKSRPQFVHNLHVKCFSGSNCGQPGKDKQGREFFRFNLGVSSQVFEEFMKRLETVT